MWIFNRIELYLSKMWSLLIYWDFSPMTTSHLLDISVSQLSYVRINLCFMCTISCALQTYTFRLLSTSLTYFLVMIQSHHLKTQDPPELPSLPRFLHFYTVIALGTGLLLSGFTYACLCLHIWGCTQHRSDVMFSPILPIELSDLCKSLDCISPSRRKGALLFLKDFWRKNK